MSRSKGKSGDFHNGVEKDHKRLVAEDVRVSEEGRGPGNSARRVRRTEDAPRFHVNAEMEEEKSKKDR